MATILLVEDDEPSRDMLARRLTRAGFQVIVAMDGAQAVALAHALRPNLIVMDLSLPVLDGWEATRQLKATLATRTIPVLVLTAHVFAEDHTAALAAGANAFAAKPVDWRALVRQINDLLAACESF